MKRVFRVEVEEGTAPPKVQATMMTMFLCFQMFAGAVLLARTVLRKGLEMGLLLITLYLQELHLNVISELPVGMLPVG
jgi:hypothetical protein